MKAQISVEYILITALVLLMLSPIFYYAFSTSVQSIKMNQVAALVDDLADSADVLYSLGPNSQDTLKITVPGGVTNITIANTEISVFIRLFNAVSEAHRTTNGNVSGSINISSGIHYVTVKNENNTIKITD